MTVPIPQRIVPVLAGGGTRLAAHVGVFGGSTVASLASASATG